MTLEKEKEVERLTLNGRNFAACSYGFHLPITQTIAARGLQHDFFGAAIVGCPYRSSFGASNMTSRFSSGVIRDLAL